MARNQNRPEFGEGPSQPHGEPPTELPGAVTVEADYDSESDPKVAETPSPAAGRKGLWSVMQTTAAGKAQSDDARTGENPGGPILSESVPTPGSQSLNPKSPRPEEQGPNPKSQISTPSIPASPSSPPPDSLATMIDIAPDEGLLSAQSKVAGFEAESSRRAFTAAVLGGLSIPLSGLALINAGWSRVPATALGFVAILTGLIASQEIQRSRGRKTGRRQAITGIVTGIIGTFLGPVVIAPLSRPRKGR